VEFLAPLLPAFERLGELTWDLHAAAGSLALQELAPEPFSELYLRSLYQSIRARVQRSVAVLRDQLGRLTEPHRDEAENVLKDEARIIESLRWITRRKICGLRIRCHGDLTLRRVLLSGGDFVFTGYCGENLKPWSERRIKRSPLVDIVALVQSIYRAAGVALAAETIRPDDRAWLKNWTRLWADKTSAVFVDSYFRSAGSSMMLPLEGEEREMVLRFYGLQRAFQELEVDLMERPEQAWISIERILALD
jgi:maltose alpha-D-glucosyltransferase/alpha-amylase